MNPPPNSLLLTTQRRHIFLSKRKNAALRKTQTTSTFNPNQTPNSNLPLSYTKKLTATMGTTLK